MTKMDGYLRKRRIAVVITIIVLILGSIAYFSTGVAERNNKMMYEKIYGEGSAVNNNGAETGSQIRVDTNERVPGKRALL